MCAEDAVQIILEKKKKKKDEPGGLHIASLALWSVHALRRGRNPSITSWKSPTILLCNSPWSTSVKPPLHRGPLLLSNCILTSCGDIRILQSILRGLALIIQYSGNSYSFPQLFKHNSWNTQLYRVLFKHWCTVYHGTVNISYKYCIDTIIVTHNRVRNWVGKTFFDSQMRTHKYIHQWRPPALHLSVVSLLQHTRFKWMGRYQASAEPHDEQII